MTEQQRTHADQKMFDKLPEKQNIEWTTDNDGNESPLLPAQHTEADFADAVNYVETNKQLYTAYGAIYPGQIEPSEYLRIWQSFVDDSNQYIRPDILVAAVHYIIDSIVSDALEDPMEAISAHWGGETKLDRRIDELSKRLKNMEVK